MRPVSVTDKISSDRVSLKVVPTRELKDEASAATSEETSSRDRPSGEITNAYTAQRTSTPAYHTVQRIPSIIPLAFIDPAYQFIYEDMYTRSDPGMGLRERFMALELSNVGLYQQASNSGLPITGASRDPFDLIFLKNNVIPIKGPVNDKMADDVSFMSQHILAAMIRTGIRKPVHFQINSPGGSIVSMNSILEDMNRLKSAKVEGEPVVVATYCNGMAASAASIIFTNGTKGYRYVGPISEVMIHQPLGGAYGRATAVDIRTKRIQRFKDWILQFFKENTKVSEDELKRLLEEDTFISPEEAIEKGFADQKYDRFATEQNDDFNLESLFKTSEGDADSGSMGARTRVFNPLDSLVLGKAEVKNAS